MIKESKKPMYATPLFWEFRLPKIRQTLCASPIQSANTETIGDLSDGDNIW